MEILIVGAGLTGAVISRQLADAGNKVYLVDKRDHIAGNAYDYVNEHGIRVHWYGPHLFHTNNMRVVGFLSRFTEWLPYRHRVKALLTDGRYVPFPVNRESATAVGEEHVLDVFYRPYTRKMWGMELEEMNDAVIKRVPIRDDDCLDYFPNDQFQALPKDGYTVMVQRMLTHKNITVTLSTPFEKTIERNYDFIFNSMPIDEYYEFCFGELPYRSIKFNHKHTTTKNSQPATVVNYTNGGIYTRCTEWIHLPGHAGESGKTTLTYEQPCDYRETGERYYPIKDRAGENRKLYKQYAKIPNEKTMFVGRCGRYVYIDMHQAVNSALSVAKKFIAEKNFT